MKINLNINKTAIFVTMLIFLGTVIGAYNHPQAQNRTINLCDYKMTFADDFDSLSVSNSNNERTRWSAHTPWSGDFGDAKFIDPISTNKDSDKYSPFQVRNGMLTIRAQKHDDGKWTSGLLSSTDSNTAGFAQAYGYFEARMKLPPGPGVWPAFWLATNAQKGDKAATVEIDVIEYYGQFSDRHHSVLHVWDKNNPKQNRGEEIITKVPDGALVKNFHTYGVEVNKDFITYYLDRREIGHQATPKEHNRPLGVLINLALGSGWPIDKTPNPSDLIVDYIHVYELDGRNKNNGCSNNSLN